MFGWTKGKKPDEKENQSQSPKWTDAELKLLTRVSNDFENARAVRMASADETGYSIEETWEDEEYIYKGGGLQWLTNIAYRSKRTRQYRPNSEDNLVFNAINALHANISANIPETTIDDDKQGELADKLTDAIRFNDERNNFSQTYKRWVYDIIGTGPTIAMVTWDNEWMGGTGPSRWIGDVRVSRENKWDIYFDPAISDLEQNMQDCSFIIRRPRKKLASIKTMWENGKYVSEMMNEDDDAEEGSNPEQAYIEEYWHRGFPYFVPKNRAKVLREKAMEFEVDGDYYRAQDYFDAAKGDLEGIHVAYIADGVLLEYCPYEYEDGLYPFVYTDKYRDDKCQYGFGEIRNIKIPQIMHNKADEITLEAMSAEGLGGYLYQKGSINPRQHQNIIENNGKGGMLFEVDNLQGIEPRSGARVPSYVSEYKEHKQRMIDTVSQVTPTMQGQTPGANARVGVVQELGARSDIRIKQAAEKLEDFLIKIKKLQISRMAQFYTEDRYFRVKGTNNEMKEGTINASELHQEWTREYEPEETVDPTTGQPIQTMKEKKERFVPEFDIKVTILSEKPTDRGYYTQLAFNLYQMQLMVAEDLYHVLEEGKLPPTNDILDHLEKQNQAMALMAQIQKLPPEAQGMAMQQITQAMTEFAQQVQLAQMIPDMQGGQMNTPKQ